MAQHSTVDAPLRDVVRRIAIWLIAIGYAAGYSPDAGRARALFGRLWVKTRWGRLGAAEHFLAEQHRQQRQEAGHPGDPEAVLRTVGVDDPSGGERAERHADADPRHNPGDALGQHGGRDAPLDQAEGGDEG